MAFLVKLVGEDMFRFSWDQMRPLVDNIIEPLTCDKKSCILARLAGLPI